MDVHKEAEHFKDLGNKKFQSGQHDEAISYYTQAIDLAPSAIYYANRAAAYLAQGKVDRALSDCNRAIEKDPKYIKAYSRRGQTYLQMGKLMEAELDFKKVLEVEPKNSFPKEQIAEINKARVLQASGMKAVQEENWSLALSTFRDLKAICHHSHDANLGIADAMIGLKNYTDAKTVATSILQDEPENPHALLIRGLAMYYMGELAAASKLFGNILQLDPDSKKAQKYWKLSRQIENCKEEGNREFREGRHEAAIKLWTDGFNLDPTNASINKILLANKGAALKSLGKYDEAVSVLSQCLEIDNEYLKAYTRRAQCYMELKKYEEAERDFNMASMKDPGDKELKRSLAEAKKLRKQALRKDYYQILGVDKNFDERELTKAYKRRCLECHPDRKPAEEREEAEKQFKEVQEAYDILKDPRKKQAYDSGADLEDINGGGGGGGFHGGDVDISELFNMFGGGGGGGGGFRTHFSTGPGFRSGGHGGYGGFPF